ncbi:putative phage holin [Nocardia sp. NPDC003999]
MSTRRNRVVLVAAAMAGLVAFVAIPDREAAATVYLGAIAALGWLFVGAYARSAWRSTAAGRGVMRLMVCLSVICTQGMATILTDYSYPGRDVIRPLLLLAIALAILDLLLTLVRLQRARGGDAR